MNIRELSICVNNVIDIVKGLDYGYYNIDSIFQDIEYIRECINFIDNNIYIKNTLGKSIRYVGVIESKSNQVEVYNYAELQKEINKASSSYFIG